MGGFEKKFRTPLIMREILRPISEARSFPPFSQVLYQNETTAGSQVSEIKFSSKSTHPNVHKRKVGGEKRVGGGRYCSTKFARLGSVGSASWHP
jgi:hypothetical protein